jgi:apolipoprotein N-acyltransferase
MRCIGFYTLPIVSGFLIGTSYIPFPPWALFFCLTPLFVFWMRAASAREALIGGWITQFILNLIGFHWIAFTAVEFGHFPAWAGVLVLVGFAAIGHLYYPLAGWVAFHLIRVRKITGAAALFTFVLTFALIERFYPMIFPWHLGYPWLWANLPGAQFADVIGFEGLNFVSIVANALLALAIVSRANKKGAVAFVASAVALVAAVNLAGAGRAERWKNPDGNVNFTLIQGNIGNFEKLYAELRENFGRPIVAKYSQLSKNAVSKHPDSQIIMWPETAFPHLLDAHAQHEPLALQARALAQELKTPLLSGAYSAEPNSRDTYNGLFFINAAGQSPFAPYRKSILLVFGETFPFSEYIDYMSKLFPNQGQFGRGKGPTVFDFTLDGKNPGRVRVGAQICYEGLYPWFSAKLARDGAQVFVNVTNDSWFTLPVFGVPFETNQHLYMTLARAIEFRRPLVRSTNTGISTAILASGEILEKSPLREEWFGLYRIGYQSEPPHTIYETVVLYWPWLLTISLGLLLVFGGRRMHA